MDNKKDFTLTISNIIKDEISRNPDIQYLTPAHAPLINQIVSNYNLPLMKQNGNAEMIYVGAPTGAGKEALVRKIIMDNPDKNFLILNMDMFRHYHNEIVKKSGRILDKDFAEQTNQTSFELYHIIQKMILKEFAGINIIQTGTMRNLEWIINILEQYKNVLSPKYTLSLSTLAVPANESAFSIFERYLNMVKTRESSEIPLRYTSLSYHHATIKDFCSNLEYFENSPDNHYFESIKVYRRSKNILDNSENTLIYDSNSKQSNTSATICINNIINSTAAISTERVLALLDIIKNNSDYLKSQGLYNLILTSLLSIVPQLKSLHDKSFQNLQ